VLRLSMPENASFESFDRLPPTGRKLAFVASLNRRMMLWVRALHSLEAKPMAGTDNAAWPFGPPLITANLRFALVRSSQLENAH
jgi:hypothetical protein